MPDLRDDELMTAAVHSERSEKLATHSFFLGGYDLEMVTIRDWLRRQGARLFDKQLTWGARASSYADEIATELAAGRRPVLIELEDDLGLHLGGASEQVIVIDHHGPRAGKNAPTALRQTFELLSGRQGEWTRWFELVDANDRGHVRAMLECGAAVDELRSVRAADRAAQGVTDEQEQAGRRAAEQAKRMSDGLWTLVRSPHGRTSVIADSLDRSLGGPGFDHLLVLWPEGQQFFGVGRVVTALDVRFPGGYFGGELPDRGYWGHPDKLHENSVCGTVDLAVRQLRAARDENDAAS